MTREDKVIKYMQDWRGGYWQLNKFASTMEVCLALAEEVVAYFDVKETPENLREYYKAADRLLASGGLELVSHDRLFAVVVKGYFDEN